jgi:dTDP-4-dehydrorhamnose reductase
MGKGKLLVTGANGLLGNKIIRLAQNNYVATPIHHIKPLHSKSQKLDIRDANAVLNLFDKFEPATVIHTASETNVDKCEIEKEHAWKTNAQGTRNIAEACRKVSAKLVFISTDYVFDGEKGLYSEEDKPNPVNYYGVTKLEGEKQVINYCENYAILRTSVLYGWHQWKQNFATWIINKLKQRQEITVVEDHYNTPTLAGNLAEVAIEVAEKDLQGIYHASGNERISRYEFAKQIAKTFDLNSDLIKPVKMSQVAAWIAKRPRDSSLDTGKIQKKIKTKPLNITEGLNKMKEEMKT